MKIFPVLFGLLLFGFINLNSVEGIRDLDVETKYTFVTSYTHYYFRVKVSNLVNMYLQLSANDVDINSKADCNLDICGFYDYPSDEEAICMVMNIVQMQIFHLLKEEMVMSIIIIHGQN